MPRVWCRMPPRLLLFLAALVPALPVRGESLPTGTLELAAKIDSLLAEHWQAKGLAHAAPADATAFLRRLTLDLAGRIPTPAEARSFAEDPSPDKRRHAVARLLDSSEYSLHWGRVLDEMVQGKRAGDDDFVAYLRNAVASQKPWNQIFREAMVGPWDNDDQKRATRFLAERAKDLDDMTRDTAAVFFGVDISCARCHDHPLVDDWKQAHYYGMSSFFNRTEYNKGKRWLTEKSEGEVSYISLNDGEKHTAELMFLSGQVIEERPVALSDEEKALREERKKAGKYVPPPFSRRQQLVDVALKQRTFFSRALANRIWHYLLGRGLVHPVDQMHSANPPSIPGLLELLADDLAEHDYQYERLIAAITASRVYQLSSQPPAGDRPPEEHFAFAILRPLAPRQFAMALLLATGEGNFPGENRRDTYLELEAQSEPFLPLLDPRVDEFQSSVSEALFLSNSDKVQALVAPSDSPLIARLNRIEDTGQLVDAALWHTLSRPAQPEERTYLAAHLEEVDHRPQAISNLIWSLITSGEFRFNH